jgi:uncharacterized protein (TIGR02646 family)
MTWLKRGLEPAQLRTVRTRELGKLRALGRAPTSKEIDGYRCVSEDLWKTQYLKCCYCEAKIFHSNNDVEHFRPKAEADRTPGCMSRHGYWWLAFTWSNMLYCCANCNRIAKNIRFPLDTGSKGAVAEDQVFPNEVPLLIDPYEISPALHIVYVHIRVNPHVAQWLAQPRGNSKLGNYTIHTVGLNRAELIELRDSHFKENLQPAIKDFHDDLATGNGDRIRLEHNKLKRFISPRAMYSAFNYDVLCQEIPNDKIRVHGCVWPDIDQLWP